MRRCEINAIMAQADEMIRSFGFVLPPFAYWTPEEFKSKADIARRVIDGRCGWDITDYGAGRFDQMGLFLFTLRNGELADLQRGDCFRPLAVPDVTSVFVVDCEFAHGGEVLAITPGTAAESLAACGEIANALSPAVRADLPDDTQITILLNDPEHRCAIVSPSNQLFGSVVDG